MKKLKINLTTLIIVALLFGLGGLSLLTYIKTREVLNTDLETQISSLTLSSGAEVGLWLLAHKKEMEVMADTPLIENGDQNAIISYLRKETKRNIDYEQFFVMNNLGGFFTDSGQIGNAVDRDYFNKVMATGMSVISDPLISKGTGNQIIVVAAPIIKDNKVVGLIGGNIKLTELIKIVTSKEVGEIGSSFLVQQDGLVITHPDHKLIMTYNPLKDENASPDLKDAIHKMVRGETGFTRYSFQNEDKYLAYVPVPGVKWSMGVTVPVAYVANQLRYLPIYFIVTTIFFGFLLAYFLSHWLVVPLTKLAEFTTELNDNLHERVDIYQLNSPVIEVKTLAANFRKMVAALQESFRDLESSKANLENEIIERSLMQVDLEKSYEELEASEEELRCNYEKLQSKEVALRESERRFRSMLENVELITVIIDKNGNVIFCNDFALSLTGFQKNEVIGKNYFDIFIPNETLKNAKTWFEQILIEKKIVGHNNYPIQTKNGEKRSVNWNNTLLFDLEGNVSGVSSIGEDITVRKQFQKKLEYMSFHDALTGLFNRTYFEEKLRLLEAVCFAPVGMIVCDVDGLKLVNDTLGHTTGDQLLRLTASIIKACFRQEDLLFRIGGDEFAIILPQSELLLVQQACHRIRRAVERHNKENIEFPLSLSVGFAVSELTNVNVSDVFKEADNNMYREKLHRSKSTRSAIVQALMKALEVRDFITEGHADRLQDLVVSLGREIDLSERNLADLRLLAQFHDIGKVGIPDRILFKSGRLNSEEFKEMQRHSEIGHRIAQSAPDLLPIADHILRHHEWWNGKGYPLGLKADAIPLECRILAIADAYDAMTSDRPYRKALSQEEAFRELNKNVGIQFDPQLVPIFIKVIAHQL
ncbi:HD domain-containing phosphohydrolase [Desulfosporosinus sp. OT]|uniref:HD domain-containing phosphohydrolase n=1 Tax=Desulfosporosinus sp. OT TaxID=913865 RepID=UPI0002F68967|nr:HD domain-containing phosphohydrolase [Desulfosporosinus sp. OT]